MYLEQHFFFEVLKIISLPAQRRTNEESFYREKNVINVTIVIIVRNWYFVFVHLSFVRHGSEYY